MAALMTSRSGSTAMNINARPTTWNVSMTKTSMKCEDMGFFHDLKTHIRRLRKSVPISGTANVITMHQNQAIRSSSGNVTTNCLSRPERERERENDGFFKCNLEFPYDFHSISNSIVQLQLQIYIFFNHVYICILIKWDEPSYFIWYILVKKNRKRKQSRNRANHE